MQGPVIPDGFGGTGSIGIKACRHATTRPAARCTQEAAAGRGGGDLSNVAVTTTSVPSETTQLPLPEQAPPQPVKLEPVPAIASSSTLVPFGREALQFLPQSIPAGADATWPEPAPARTTVSRGVVFFGSTAWRRIGASPFGDIGPPQPRRLPNPKAAAARARCIGPPFAGCARLLSLARAPSRPCCWCLPLVRRCDDLRLGARRICDVSPRQQNRGARTCGLER